MADNNKNKLNTNTSGVNFYNSEEGYKVNSTLRTGYWNDKCLLSVYPKLETPTDGRVFDYDNQMAAFLSVGDVNALVDIMKNSVASQAEGKEYRKAIPTGKGMVEFGTSNSELGLDTPYINICETGDDKIVKASMLYQFKPTIAIENYCYADGSYDISRDAMGEVKQLINALESAEDALSNAYAHTIIERDKYAKEKLQNNIVKIMDKLGIPVEYTGAKKSSGNGYNRWDSAKVATSTNKNLPEEHTSDIDAEDIYG